MQHVTRQRGPGRRSVVAGAAAFLVAAPRIARAQSRQIVVGGPSTFGALLQENFFGAFTRAHNVRIAWDGSTSITHLQKLRANRDRPEATVVMMDDPIMVTADDEGLLGRITAAAAPNVGRVPAGAMHRDGAWVNYMLPSGTIAYNTDRLPQGVASWAELWDARFRGQLIVPTLQLTQGVLTLIVAAHLASGLSYADALRNPDAIDAGFRKLAELKPNVMLFTPNSAQSWSLLEAGEAAALLSMPSQPVAARRRQGVPIDVAHPREGAFAMPNAMALVKNAPNAELGALFINEFLGDAYQSRIAEVFNANPVVATAAVPAGFTRETSLHAPDWEYIARNRAAWTDRWAREISS